MAHAPPPPGGYPQQGSFHGAPGAPGGYPPAGAPGAYPPHAGSFHGAPGAPGAYPPAAHPPAGAPGGYPPHAGSFHGAPGGAPAAPAINPATLQMLQQFWLHADSDRSGSISVPELATLPFPGNGPYAGRPIGPAAAQLLIHTFDRTRTGQLNWDTFCGLFQWLDAMQMHFLNADRDRGGTLDLGEMPAALYQCGYQLPPHELQGYMAKHSTHGQCTFLQFMALVCDLQQRQLGIPPMAVAPGAHGAVGGAHGAHGAAGKKGGKKGKDGKKKDGKKKDKKKKGGSGSGLAGAIAEGAVEGVVSSCASIM